MKKPQKPTTETTDEDLAITKAAAWAWHQRGTGSESRPPTSEFSLTRTQRVPNPTRYKLEAMKKGPKSESPRDHDPSRLENRSDSESPRHHDPSHLLKNNRLNAESPRHRDPSHLKNRSDSESTHHNGPTHLVDRSNSESPRHHHGSSHLLDRSDSESNRHHNGASRVRHRYSDSESPRYDDPSHHLLDKYEIERISRQLDDYIRAGNGGGGGNRVVLVPESDVRVVKKEKIKSKRSNKAGFWPARHGLTCGGSTGDVVEFSERPRRPEKRGGVGGGVAEWRPRTTP